jgi:hypothetical protein
MFITVSQIIYFSFYSFFGFAVVFAIVESSIGHRFVRLAYTLIFFGLALAIGGIAFAYGFWN